MDASVWDLTNLLSYPSRTTYHPNRVVLCTHGIDTRSNANLNAVSAMLSEIDHGASVIALFTDEHNWRTVAQYILAWGQVH